MRLAGDKFMTPYTTKALRKLKLEFRHRNDPEITLKLFKAAFTNIAKASIQSHRVKRLEEIVKMEKKCYNGLVTAAESRAFRLW